MHEKSRSGLAIALGGLALLVAGGTAAADGLICHCPPPLRWCSEQAPCIKFKCACPRPVCDPCDLPHYGVFATCWHPWPFQPNWSHCQSPPPAAALPAPAYPPYAPRAPQEPRPEAGREPEFPKPRPSELKDEPDSPQVRSTAYRVVERPAAPVTQARRPSRPAAEEAPARLPQTLVAEQEYETPLAPAPQAQAARPGIRFVR